MNASQLLAWACIFWNPKAAMLKRLCPTCYGLRKICSLLNSPRDKVDDLVSFCFARNFVPCAILVTYLFPDLPVAEVFAFTFNTLLCDMAIVDAGFRQQIFNEQENILEKCVQTIAQFKEKPESADSEWIFQILIPVTFGICRALGRFGHLDNFLITKLFPTEPPPPSPASQMVITKQNFSNFR